MIGPDEENENEDLENAAHAQGAQPGHDEEEGDDTSHREGSDVSRQIEWLEQRYKTRLARKPDLSKLSPAVVNGEPQFDKGTRVVVERRISFVDGHPWLDTCVYTVLHVDLASGIVQALNEERGHRSYLSFKDAYHDWFLCPKSGNPLAKPRRRRRRRNLVA